MLFGLMVSVAGNPEAGFSRALVQSGPEKGADMLMSLSRTLHLVDEETGILKCGLPAVAYAREHLGDGFLSAALTRPEKQKNILRGNVRVHYDTTGTHTPFMLDQNHQQIPGTTDEFADSVASVANYVIYFETAVLGYPIAPADGQAGGGEEYDIYVEQLGNLYGYTSWEVAIAPRRYTTYMVIDNDFIFVLPDSNRGIPGLKVTLAHEYHHAIQIGNYGWWGDEHRYFYEMTSVWMEDKVYTEVNDYYAYLRSPQGHFKRPEISFVSNQFIMYSRGIWCHYLEKKYSRDLVRGTWENIRHAPPLEALDETLQGSEFASSFRTAFAEWTLWNFFTGTRANPEVYYDEGIFYPQVTEKVSGFSPPSRVVADSLSPLSARYHQVLYNADTLTLALSNINVDAAVADPGEHYPYFYSLSVSQIDPTYKPTSAGIFYKFQNADATNWHTWSIVNGGITPAPLREAVPFPNPFIADGRKSVYIPVGSTEPVAGTLTIFTASMVHVYSATAASVLRLGNHVFAWDGRTDDGEIAQSGVYLFVLELPGRMLKGKVAVMRE